MKHWIGRKCVGPERNGAGRLKKGSAAVELAVVSPVLLAILFGIIEFGWLFTVQNTLINAAREGARLGVIEGITLTDVEARITDLLQPMNLVGHATVTITEATTDDPTVSVRITVPRDSVSLVGSFFGFSGGTLEGQCSMRREGI